MEIFPRDRWIALAETSKELRRSFCELFDAVSPEGKLDFETLIRNVNPLLGVLESENLSAIFSNSDTPRGAVHPSLRWSEILLETVRRDSSKSRDLQYEEASGILERLERLCPHSLKGRMESLRNELRKLSRQATFHIQLDRVRRWAKTSMARSGGRLSNHRLLLPGKRERASKNAVQDHGGSRFPD